MTYQFAEINGTQIHYEVRGEGAARSGLGSAVTLIHAGVANLTMWDDQMELLSKEFRVLRYDMRGWGQTPRPDGDFHHHEDLRALLQQVGIEKTVIIGCSFGGKVALDFALAHPEMVSALMLVGAALGGYEWADEWLAAQDETAEAAAARGDLAAAAELETQIWFDGPGRTPDQVNLAIRKRAYDLSLHTLTLPEGGGRPLPIEPPAIARLAEIQVPARIIVGQYDVADIQAIGKVLETRLPLAETVTIMRHTAHLPNMERPSTFNNLALDFLEKVAWRSTIYAILPHETEARLWLQASEQGFTLPHMLVAGGMWDTEEAAVQRPLQRHFGDNVQVLYRAHFQGDKEAKTTESVFVLDNDGVTVADGRGVSLAELPTVPLAQPAHRPIMARCLREWETGDVSPLRPPWARRGWHREVAGWIETKLARVGYPQTGPLQPVRQWSLSCVLRADTAVGPFYFKTVADLPLFVNEARTVSKLAQLYPRHVVTPLAVDRERDWMLLPELTEMVGWGAPLAQREAFLQQFGRLQVTAVAHVDELLDAGCLDRRLHWLAAQIEPLITAEFVQPYLTTEEQAQLQASIPRLQTLCQELAAFAIPETLVHGDLHGGNVAVQGDDFIYFDWTDACVSHPFFDMLNIFMERDTAVQTQLRDAYLAQWTDVAPMPRLLAAWSLAEVLGAVHHAISYWQIVAHLEPHSRNQLETWLQWWLRRVLALATKLETQDK
ncbi:MAG: alpha/beta fold hydrolase [Anaerolineae bacterium]|nr:alpha/beta fold hydrolase [Anaerolineae bacterium]